MQAGSTQPPSALLVDLDETLVDHSGIPGSIAQACELIAAQAAGLDARKLQEANAASWSSHWRAVEKLCWVGQMDGFSVSAEVWRRALHDCDCIDESVIRFAVEAHHKLGRSAYRMFDDVGGFLASATSQGIRLALVTNGPSDFQRDKLAAVGLIDVFDAIVISGECGVAKPDAAIFRLALERLGAEPEDVWHIGDSISTDVVGAKKAGLSAVWLNRQGRAFDAEGGVRPDAEVRSLYEVTEMLGMARRFAT
jgi:FMN phosphatase YigB (HAD superfamily)